MEMRQKTNWGALSAEGEYYDFSKLDFASAEKEMNTKNSPQPVCALPKKLPKGVEVMHLRHALENNLVHRSNFWALPDFNAQKTDKAAAWHAANVQGGFFVHAAEGASAQVSLGTSAPSNSALHSIIVLEKGAKLDIVLECSGAGKINQSRIHTDFLEAFAAEDSELTLSTVQNYPESDFSFTNVFTSLGRFSRLRHASGIFGGAASRTRIQNHLIGPHSKAESLQAFFIRNSQFADVTASTFHHVPDTSGEMRAKGALLGKSRSAYKGYIKIDEGARNTITHQAGTALLLSKESSANVMPALDVENNEVEAGHGAAVGELSDEEMVYLRSRGLSEDDSRFLIVEGYFSELLGKFPSQTGRKAILDKISARMGMVKSKKGM